MKQKRIKYNILVLHLLVFSVLSGCIDPFKIELNAEDAESILVVEGLITNEQGSFEIKLSRSVPIDTMVSFIPESGAVITISDDQDNVYELLEGTRGVYKCLQEDARAITGRSYKLSIIDSNNKEYESTSVLMQGTPAIENVNWEESIETIIADNEVFEELGIDISVSTNDPTKSTRFFKWDIYETWEVLMPDKITALDGNGMPYQTFVVVPTEKKYCWVTQKSQNILVKSVDNQSNSRVENFPLKRIGSREDKLFVRYSVEVKQYSLNKEMYKFWDKLKEFNEDAGSLYDRVPLSIYGNISCCDNDSKVLGYFHASEVKSKRIFIERGQHKVVTVNDYEGCTYVRDFTSHPFVSGFFARSEFCSDCNFYGTNNKPDFW